MKEIADIVRRIDEFLKIKDEIREEVIRKCRDIIRLSGYVITKIHLRNFSEAKELLLDLREMVRALNELLKDHPEIRYSGTVYSALSEYVEAEVFSAIISEGKVPSPEELNVHPVPYLQGLLDVVGELKRASIEAVRERRLSDSWEYLRIAEEIMNSCKSLDYPDALIPSVRRKVDIARNIVESLRSFLTDMELRMELINKLRECKLRIS